MDDLNGEMLPGADGAAVARGDAPAYPGPVLPAAAEVAPNACPRCGGRHTSRQRCPLDDPPPPVVEAWVIPPVAVPAAAAPQGDFWAAARDIGRWCVAIPATLVLFVCVVLVGYGISRLTQAREDPQSALVAIAAACAVGVVFGMGLMYLARRVYAKIVFTFLAVTLITGGSMMMIFAPVLRQMNTRDLAEYRAFNALLGFGALSTVLGIALAALCLRWALRPHALRRIARWSRLLGSAYGVMLGISGLFSMVSLFALINAHAKTGNAESSVTYQAISFAAIAAFSMVPGLILTYQGISASMGEGSSEFRPPVAAFGFTLFGGVLLIGHVNMSSGDPIAAPMPLLHVLAAALPGATFAMMAARGSPLRGRPVRSLTWRQLTLAVAISMSVATMIATYVESIGSLAGVVLLLVHNGAFAFARDSSDVSRIISDSRFILSRDEQFFAGLITASIFAPLSEEFGKSLAVRFMLRRNNTRAQAFALGAAAGAGFGFLEAMLYGLRGISNDLGGWWQIMLLRGGSTSLHVLCAGLTGLAWWYWTNDKQHRPALGLFALAVVFHATWNAFFTAIDSRILGLETLSDRTLEVIAYSAVALVSAAFIAAIPLVARRLREAEPPSVDGTPLGAMLPWLG